MKNALGLSLILVLWTALTAQAAISLRPNDTIFFTGQTPNLSVANGGQFTWQVASTVPRTDGTQPPAVGTVFYTFCAQIGGAGSLIAPGNTYTIGSFITPVVGQKINVGGNTLVDNKGLFLFDKWSTGGITQNDNTASALQVSLWLSEGYTAGNVESEGGYTASQLSAAETEESTLLTALGYTSSWKIGANDEVAVLNNAQDQFVYVSTSSGSVPEPDSVAIWGLFGLAGAATVVASKAKKGTGVSE
jgi:hypothetical protein